MQTLSDALRRSQTLSDALRRSQTLWRFLRSWGVVVVTAFALALFPLSSFGQLLPPPGPEVYQWTGNGANTNWNTSGNWQGGSLPNSDSIVDFLALSSDAATVTLSSVGTGARSLWFNAATAYTLVGTGILNLGFGLASNGRLVTVYNSSGTYGAETNINSSISLHTNSDSTPRTFVIENESEGGLGFLQNIRLNSQHLIIAGGKATRIAGRIFGNTFALWDSITIQSGSSYGPTHLVLSNNNFTWHGRLIVQSQAMVIAKRDQSSDPLFPLGYGPNTVQTGGTIAFRHHAHEDISIISWDAVHQLISVQGHGVVRQTGRAPVGAIYNDGGRNSHKGSITLTGDTWFGSRGDIGGYLQIQNGISGGNTTFTKVGPGLIILSNNAPGSNANAWFQTELKGGVLRPETNNALPTANISFNGGIVEYGSVFTNRSLGTGTSQIQWTGDGGFSAFAGDRTVSLNSGAALTWGQQYFVGSGRALLLGSRYANRTITFANALDFAGGIREVRVARGVLPTGINATGGGIDAVLSGRLTNGGLRKTGDGLLQLTRTDNSYTGDTAIAGGGLLSNNIPTASNIVFDAGSFSSGTGGILLLQSDFTRSLGSGAGQIRWQGSGGFAAYGGDRIVNIGGNSGTLNWEGELPWRNDFVPGRHELRFGHYAASGTVVFQNPLYLDQDLEDHTFRVERGEANKTNNRADVVMTGGLSSEWVEALGVLGDGRMDLNVATPDLEAAVVQIFGAELRLNEGGTLENVSTIDLRHGGTLTLDNVGTYNSATGGVMNDNRLDDSVTIQMRGGRIQPRSTFDGGQLRYEDVSRIEFLSGANIIDAVSRDLSLFLGANTVLRTTTHRSTLHIPASGGSTNSPYYLTVNTLPQSGNTHGITPWITIGGRWGSFFGTPASIPYDYFLGNDPSAVQNVNWDYNLSNNQSTWATSIITFHNTGGENHNILLTAPNTTLSTNRYINSLILSGQTTLNLPNANHRINLVSGGLMTTGAGNSTITGSSTSEIQTGSTRIPFYLHIYNDKLTLDKIRIPSYRDVIKTGPGELHLKEGNHQVGSLYIHQGLVNLESGTLTFGSGISRIYIGDGAGTDILQLAPNTRDQIKRQSGLPSITLHGTPYAQRGPEYGGDQAILRMGGNTKLHLDNLHIDRRGTIDWVGGEVSQANILYLNSLTFSGPNAILFMRNWYEYEDYLLVSRTWFDGLSAAQQALTRSQVRFEGYEDFPVISKIYDYQYYQITLFGAPEPTTYGAILGAIGLGLWTWRKKRQTQ